MKLGILVDKTACFYYWIQVVSNWDPHAVDNETYNYYMRTLSADYKPALNEIKTIIQSAKEPRWILAELYTGNPKLNEAKKVVDISKSLAVVFEPIWEENLSHLEKWRANLQSMDFTKFANPLQKIIDFLDSDFGLQSTHTLYLVQNPPGHRAVGLTINETNFILVRPSSTGKPIELNNTISVIAHEYIHAIEQKSKNSRELFKESYSEYIKANNIPPPVGYTWKMMYVEALTYCFASTVTRGYLSPEIYDKSRPTISEMEDGFWRLFKSNKHSTQDNINWVALNILPQVEEYIKHGKKIDRHISDRMGKIFLELYLT